MGGTPLYLRGLLYGIFEGPAADWALRGELMRKAQEHGPEVLHEELRKLDPTTADRLHPRDLVRVIRALEVAARERAAHLVASAAVSRARGRRPRRTGWWRCGAARRT